MKIDIREILFWIFLILGMILLVWNVFGNSPSEFIALATIMLTMLLKIWQISDRQIRQEMKFDNLKNSFIKLSNDFKEYTSK